MSISTVRAPKRIVGVSTKLYFSAQKTQTYISELLDLISRHAGTTLLNQIDVFIIPDLITLSSAIDQITQAQMRILPGAQDTFYEDVGAYTGEVSPAVLAEVGCRIVEIGHAERRRIFRETDSEVARKAAAVCRNGMLPLVCIGEKNAGPASAAVGECSLQIEAVITAVPDAAEMLLAYEPVWAIGAAEPADSDHVIAVVSAIKQLACIRQRTGTVRVLYGGSAGPGLFEKLSVAVDGLFIGRFGHDPKQFLKTIQEVAHAS